ncbi:MAG TPA: sugar ABC transporter permease [Kineosporiaceae bacterium]|nr:sugar ABC transporter permease [Kineosporiaceae bacterium]
MFVAPAMLLIGLFFLVPLVYMGWMSLQEYPLLGERKFVGLKNYADALKDPTFRDAVVFTVEYTLLVVPLLLIVGFGLASLVRRRRRGAALFRTVFFLPVVVGFASASFLWSWLVDVRVGPLPVMARLLGLGTQDSPWLGTALGGLLVVTSMVIWKMSGFTMLLLMAGMQGIPEEVLEAARVDGAGRWRMLWSITLPLLRPAITLVLVLTTAGSMLAFEQFLIITGGGPAKETTTIVAWIYNQSFVRFRLGYGAALSLLLGAVLLVISAFQLRLLRSNTE